MKTFLALDSSTSVTSVACVVFGQEGTSILLEENSPHARSDSSALFLSLEKAVRQGGTPDALCVGLGPGSYNGLRASIAAARAFATALGIPLHALPSSLAIPASSEKGFWAIGDARGGHYWIDRVFQGAFAEEPVLLSPEEACRNLSRLDLPIFGASPLAGIDTLQIATPSASLLATLAWQHDPAYLVPLTPEPLYLKPPHITTPKAPKAIPSP